MAEPDGTAEARAAYNTNKADADLEMFAHALAHDLRAPLRAIGGFSELLLETPPGKLEPLAREYLPRIVAATTRMAQLLEDLLELSRVANVPIATQQVELAALAKSVVHAICAQHPERMVDVKIDGDIKVKGDLSLLRTALEQLIGNAWKFTSQVAQAQIRIQCETKGAEVVVSISDNGAGFDMRQSHRLFQPLQRLHRADEFAGSGVGLSIVNRIIDRHGGRVWADSSTAGGATFSFSLPC
jgi:signal transduction histidine kinase